MDVLHFLSGLWGSNVDRADSELEILETVYKSSNLNVIRKFIRTRNEHGKDANKSQSLRQAGNEFYSKQDYVDAMVHYNESLEFAPPDSLEYATALANRSTLLFELKRYKDCLVDINRVLGSKYPKLLMHKVFIRQAKCFLELKSYDAVEGVLQNFKQWLQIEQGNLSTKNFEYITENIRAIENSLTDKPETILVDEPESTLPVVTGGENQKFAYASKKMLFKKNAQGVGGRHVLANSDVKKGDILFVEEPYSTSCTSTHSGYFTYCNQCFISSLTCIPCKYCTEIYFCTEECREDYWNLRHKWECLAIRKRLLSTKCSLALGIFFRASRTGFKTTAKNDHSYGNKEENFPYVNQLLTHKMKMAESDLIYKTKETVLMLVYLIEYTDFIDWLYAQENRPEVSRDAVYKVIGNILLKIVLQIATNSETVLHSFVMFEDKFSPGLNYHTVAVGLYVSSCLMNHSCLPNAVRSFHGSTKVVRALRDIKKGTEVTICYLRDPDINSHKARQSALLKDYLFNCSCRVCTNPNWIYPWLCFHCQGAALTTSDNRLVKCRNCNHTFSADMYVHKESRAHAYRGIYGLYDLAPSNLEMSLNIIHLYHKNNYKFMYWYSLIVESCDSAGDFRRSLQYVTKMAQLQRVILGDNACIGNMNMELKRCNGLVNCCLSFDDKTTENYKTALQDAKDGIDRCCDMLKYHMRSELVECYKENMWKILSAGDLNYDQTVQLYHFNSIPFSTKVKVQAYTTNTSYHSFKR
ncbi:SET and MYND domain containing class 4 member 3 [Carabus blaptoides fortunei]